MPLSEETEARVLMEVKKVGEFWIFRPISIFAFTILQWQWL